MIRSFLDDELDGVGHQFVGEGEVPHLLHVLHIVEGDALAIDLGDLLHVALILGTHHDVGDAGTLGGEDLLLDAADGQHLAAQRDLARHGRVLAHLALGQRRGQGGGDGDARRRAVLGRGALRHVDMDVPLVEEAVVNAQGVDMGLDVLQGDDGALLHHVAKIARERQFAGLALGERGLDEEDLAAHAGPGQARHHARVVVALVDVAVERWLSKQALYLVWSDFRVWQFLVLCLHEGQFP